MYRLLIVTQDPDAKARLSAMTGWEAMGFKPPRLLSDAKEAMEWLGSHSVDAIAVEESPAFDELERCLIKQYPIMPLFEIAPDEEQQRSVIRELYSFLKRLRADDSNAGFDREFLFVQQRERWLRRVMAGLETNADDIRRRLRLHRCHGRIGVPCVIARLALPGDDDAFFERWHYGIDRLETALLNFFGSEHDRMLIHVAVISPEEVRVLCYPADPAEELTEEKVLAFVSEVARQVEHYVGLHMEVREAHRLASLADFAEQPNA